MNIPNFTDEEILEGLPAATPELIALDVRTIKAALSKFLREEEEPEYVVFSCVPPSAVDEMVERPRFWGGICMRTFYSADTRKLVVKLPKRPHEIVSRKFDVLIWDEARRQGLRHDLTAVGSDTIREPPYSKEADSAWVPRRQVPGRDAKWPTLVLEAGLSETLSRLRIDVKIGIIASIHRAEPNIVVEKWELRRHKHEGSDDDDQTPEVPTMVQEIAITLQQSTSTITTTGGPLVIPFHKLLLKNRTPHTIQGDFTYTAATLEEEIAKEVWESQGFLPRPL